MQIYNDASDARPARPGDPDVYRLREYSNLNAKACTFTVTEPPQQAMVKASKGSTKQQECVAEAEQALVEAQ